MTWSSEIGEAVKAFLHARDHDSAGELEESAGVIERSAQVLRERAAAIPALIRSRMMSRSNSAIAAIIAVTILPAAVSVWIASRTQTNSTPHPRNSSNSARRC